MVTAVRDGGTAAVEVLAAASCEESQMTQMARMRREEERCPEARAHPALSGDEEGCMGESG